MNLDELKQIEQIEAFLLGTQPVVFIVADDKTARYAWLEHTLVKWRYQRRPRAEKGLLLRFMAQVVGYSPAQVKRLIKQHRDTGHIRWQPAKGNGFQRRYSSADIRRLAQLDKLHGSPSGAVVKKLCERAYQLFDNPDYQVLSVISVAQIYRFRQTTSYQRQCLQHSKTQATRINIGERKKPFPNEQPGYIRIDTVHQGDLDKEKGVYHINAVDEVTQFEVIMSVVAISERFLLPILEQMLNLFPFAIKNFHSDNELPSLSIKMQPKKFPTSLPEVLSDTHTQWIKSLLTIENRGPERLARMSFTQHYLNSHGRRSLSNGSH